MLTAVADVMGVFGGFIVAHWVLLLPMEDFFGHLKSYLGVWDVVSGLIKAACFGGLITLIACREGLATENGARGVGQSTTRAVVYASMAILVANYVLTAIMTV